MSDSETALSLTPMRRLMILGAVILALGRALGETMAVTMVIGNSSTQITGSLFTPGYTLASAIANNFLEADTPIFQSSVVYCGIALLLITIGVSICARLLVNRLLHAPSAVLRELAANATVDEGAELVAIERLLTRLFGSAEVERAAPADDEKKER
jgi:hypothetical protein